MRIFPSIFDDIVTIIDRIIKPITPLEDSKETSSIEEMHGLQKGKLLTLKK